MFAQRKDNHTEPMSVTRSPRAVWLLDTTLSQRPILSYQWTPEPRVVSKHHIERLLPCLLETTTDDRRHPWLMPLPNTLAALTGKAFYHHQVVWLLQSPLAFVKAFCVSSAGQSYECTTPEVASLAAELMDTWGHHQHSQALCYWYATIRYGLRSLITLGAPVRLILDPVKNQCISLKSAEAAPTWTQLRLPTSWAPSFRQLLQDAWSTVQQLQRQPSGARVAETHLRSALRHVILQDRLPSSHTDAQAKNAHLPPSTSPSLTSARTPPNKTPAATAAPHPSAPLDRPHHPAISAYKKISELA